MLESIITILLIIILSPAILFAGFVVIFTIIAIVIFVIALIAMFIAWITDKIF